MMNCDQLSWLGLCGLLSVTTLQAKEPARRIFSERQLPNVVLILTDDLGYGDLNCYGATRYITANPDKLAAGGVPFTNFYFSQAVCSASRAALITGCYLTRIGIGGALSPASTIGLNPQEETIPEILKKKGYKSGISGKWHLGYRRQFLPWQQGFDDEPFFLYVPHSMPHVPIAASAKFRGKSDQGAGKNGGNRAQITCGINVF